MSTAASDSRLDNSAHPGSSFKTLRTRASSATSAGGLRTLGFIDRHVDNAQVNTAAKPRLSAPT